MTDKKPREKTKEQIQRKANLLAIIGEDHGSIARFARQTDTSQVYLWQIKNTERGVGERIARKIEAALDFPPGYLDQDLSAKTAEVDIFANQVAAEASKRIVPPEMKRTIMYLLRSAPEK